MSSARRLTVKEATDVISDLRANIVRQMLDVEGWTDEFEADALAVRWLLEKFAEVLAADETGRELLVDELLHDHEQAQQGLLDL